MKSDESKYDEVQKMLALKRHEQPPPRFFTGFTHEVIDRINSPEPPRPMTWHERLGWGEDSRPFWLCGLGVLVCAVLVLALIAALKVDKPAESSTQVADPSSVVTSPGNAAGSDPLPGYQALPGNTGSPGSTAPVLAPGRDNNSFLIRTQQVGKP